MIQFGRRFNIPDELSAIAAAIYFVTPVAGASGTSAFNDAALTAFSIAAILCVLDETAPPVLTGIVAGFCYAVKPTGGFVALLCAAYLLKQRNWRAVLWFSAGSIAMVAPWLVRNAIEIGNPFAPLGKQFLSQSLLPHLHRAVLHELSAQLWQRPLERVPLSTVHRRREAPGLARPIVPSCASRPSCLTAACRPRCARTCALSVDSLADECRRALPDAGDSLSCAGDAPRNSPPRRLRFAVGARRRLRTAAGCPLCAERLAAAGFSDRGRSANRIGAGLSATRLLGLSHRQND